jgi:hypothetical protein
MLANTGSIVRIDQGYSRNKNKKKEGISRPRPRAHPIPAPGIRELKSAFCEGGLLGHADAAPDKISGMVSSLLR